MKASTWRRLDALSTDGVERAEPTGPPTAFRIWKAGDNITDHGPTVFSDRSAKLLMAQQVQRGNRFPIDIDHLSLDKAAPLESRRAVGWFDVEVRNGELWAVNVEWTDVVRSGLTKEPPEWRYHSPAYDQDAETGEVTSLLNLAITNLPATHAVTALASRVANQPKDHSRMKRADGMKWSALKAAIDGDDEDAKAAAYATIAAAFPDDEAEEKDSDDGDAKKDGDDEMKCADDGEDEKKDAKASDDGDEAKKDSVADLVDQAVKAALAPFKKAQEANERKSLLATRPDFDAATLKVLAKAPIATVRDAVANLPRRELKTASTESVQATRGEGQGAGEVSRLSPEEKKLLDERMGLRRRADGIKHTGVHVTFGAMTREDAKAYLAKGVK